MTIAEPQLVGLESDWRKFAGRAKTLLLTLVLLGSCFLLAACSRLTLFVVVNKSDKPILVRYRGKTSAEDHLPCSEPGILMESQLGKSQPWRELSTSQYQLDRGVVTVSLQPDEVLRIIVTRSAENDKDEAFEAQTFCVDEIDLTGVYGEIKLQGRQAYQGFLKESWKLRKLTYAKGPG